MTLTETSRIWNRRTCGGATHRYRATGSVKVIHYRKKDLNLLRFNKLGVHLQSPHNTIYPLTANLLTDPTLRLSKV